MWICSRWRLSGRDWAAWRRGDTNEHGRVKAARGLVAISGQAHRNQRARVCAAPNSRLSLVLILQTVSPCKALLSRHTTAFHLRLLLARILQAVARQAATSAKTKAERTQATCATKN